MYYCVIKQERMKNRLNWAIRIHQDNRLIGRTRTKKDAEAIQCIMNSALKEIAEFIVFPWEESDD